MASTATDPTTQRLSEVVREGMERHRVPGVSIGIQNGDEQIFLPFGITNIDHPLPVTSETVFQVGSNTKPVTGTTVMRLVEQGLVELDAPVRRYVPSFRVADEEASRGVTIRNLMTHTAGWEGDVWTDTGRGADAVERMIEAMAELPQLAPLGEVFAYNNTAFYVLGRVIEVVTGVPFTDAATSLVLQPLGMSGSAFLPEQVIMRRFAAGHRVQDETIEVDSPWQWPRSGSAAGRLIAPAADMLRFARFHMGDGVTEDGERIMQPETLRAMQTPQFRATGTRHMGLTWFLEDIGGVRIVQHGGSTASHLSAFEFAPERRFAIVVLTNATTGGTLGQEIVEFARKAYLGLDTPKPTAIPSSSEELAAYAGHYENPSSTVDLCLEGDTLMLHHTSTRAILGRLAPPTPPAALETLGPDLLRVADGAMKGTEIEMLRDENGELQRIRLGLRIWNWV
jgi:CubicO group peptidase (beta-lactamase class C family)